MDLSKRSQIHFIVGGNTKCDRRYSIDDLCVNSLIKILQERGFEVGIHASFDSYDNFRLLNLGKKELERVVEGDVLGGRQHYLRWRIPETWRIWEKAGLKYDTTMSFADYEGFRCGICFPHKPFDLVANKDLDIWELPLTIMDRTLFDYQSLTPEEGFERIKNKIDTVKEHDGVLCFCGTILLWTIYNILDGLKSTRKP